VAALIGDYKVNIATMQVSRKQIGGNAIMVITVDGEVSEEITKAILGIEGVKSVKLISL